MRRVWYKGSYTVEAAIYIPIVLFLLFQTIGIAIDFWQESKQREVCEALQELDIVKEFYGYQILDEVRKEIEDEES
ncbi:MAG: hypothetical protein IJA07_04230 [Agathobacter sp.]|nr:hypothetical protein [Agathobacter sp.]MBQ3558702.1 hypothetical protein [Agathobacter sp.]